MTLEHSAAFLIFALVAAVTPGPSNVMLTAAGAQAGVLRGLPCLLGVSAGMALLLFGAALGLGRLVLAVPAVLQVLRWGGAIFLLWLAWRIATAGSPGEPDVGRPVGFVAAAAFQWINPKSWLVGASAAGTYLDPGSGVAAQALTLAALFVAAALPSGFVWLLFGAGMHRLLRNDRAARMFNIAMGASLAASVALILR